MNKGYMPVITEAARSLWFKPRNEELHSSIIILPSPAATSLSL